MKWVAIIATALLIGPFAAAPSAAQPAGQTAEPEVLVQRPPRSVRPRIRVQPRYPYRHYHSLYPLPYDNDFPGPNARRQCTDAYVVEHRPSGTVVTPRMRCRWVRG